MPRPAALPSGNAGHTYWTALTHAWTFHATGNTGAADADDIKGSNDATVSGATLSDSVGLDSPLAANKATFTDVTLTNGFSVMFRAKLDAVGNNSMVFGRGMTDQYLWLDAGTNVTIYKNSSDVNFSVADADKTSLYDYCLVVYPESGSLHDIKLFRKTAAGTTWTQIEASSDSNQLSDRVINTVASGYSGDSFGMTGELEYFYIFDGTSFTLANLNDEFADPYDIVESPDSITLTAQGIHARVKAIKSSGTYSVTLAGTYNGTPTAIEWRPMLTASGAGTWATLDGSPTGGAFSQAVSVDGTEWMQGLEVRFSNDTGITATDSLFTVCEVFVAEVDSLANGSATNVQNHTPRTYSNLIWRSASGWTVKGESNHWPNLCDQLSDDRPIAILNAGQGGANLTGHRASDNAVNVSAAGVGSVNGVLIHGGANDVIGTPELTTATPEDWQAELEAIADSYATAYTGCKCYFSVAGPIGSGELPETNYIREGVLLAAGNNANCEIGSNVWWRQLGDNLHPKSDEDCAEYGKAWWFALRTGATAQPVFSQATHNSAKDQVTLQFDSTLRTGTTLTAALFEVTDDGTPVTISSASVSGPNVILTLASAMSGSTFTASMGKGLNNTGTPPQGTAVALPNSGGDYYPAALPFYDRTVAAADDTAPAFASAVIPSGGTTLAITLTETGTPPVLPQTAITGFSISASGGAVSILASQRTSNTVITLALSRAILQGETVTVAYTDGNVTDSAPIPNAMANFSAQSVTNNSTATAAGGTFPTESQVLNGVQFGPNDTDYTGNVVLPSAANVLDTASFGASSGTTGTYHAPLAAEVISTAVFGVSSGTSGTVVLPAVGDVQLGVTFGASSALTGTFAVPTEAQVEDGVGFGAGGIEFTGTLVAGGGGTFPTASQVLSGIQFGPNGTDYTGNVILPSVGDVQSGVTFGPSSGSTGTFAVPTAGQVEVGVQYGAGGTEFTGTLSIPSASTIASAVRTELTSELDEIVLCRQILGNKQNVTDNGNGTFTIVVRNDADDATVRTLVYNPTTGARTVA